MKSSSFEMWYQDHHRWLLNWLRHRLNNNADAEDLTHDTFLRLVKRDAGTINEPRSYLLTIAKGLTVDLFRRRSLERQYLETLALWPEQTWPSEEDNAMILETLAGIDAMFDGLGSRVRQTFILSQLEGLTYPQIARQLGVSVRTINLDMAKAMQHCCLYQMNAR